MTSDYCSHGKWRLSLQVDYGGKAVNALQRYEIIRPILKGEKTPKQVSEETSVPLSTIYRYLKRFREGDGNMESLADESHANNSHPNWFTREDNAKVVQYKLQHPHLSSRQIAKALAQEDILQIHDRTVANILKESGLTSPFFSINHLS
jgi:transposase